MKHVFILFLVTFQIPQCSSSLQEDVNDADWTSLTINSIREVTVDNCHAGINVTKNVFITDIQELNLKTCKGRPHHFTECFIKKMNKGCEVTLLIFLPVSCAVGDQESVSAIIYSLYRYLSFVGEEMTEAPPSSLSANHTQPQSNVTEVPAPLSSSADPLHHNKPTWSPLVSAQSSSTEENLKIYLITTVVLPVLVVALCH